MTITAAADGSSLGNPGPAGWAWYVDEDTWDAGGWPKGTNNLGELTAIGGRAVEIVNNLDNLRRLLHMLFLLKDREFHNRTVSGIHCN